MPPLSASPRASFVLGRGCAGVWHSRCCRARVPIRARACVSSPIIRAARPGFLRHWPSVSVVPSAGSACPATRQQLIQRTAPVIVKGHTVPLPAGSQTGAARSPMAAAAPKSGVKRVHALLLLPPLRRIHMRPASGVRRALPVGRTSTNAYDQVDHTSAYRCNADPTAFIVSGPLNARGRILRCNDGRVDNFTQYSGHYTPLPRC